MRLPKTIKHYQETFNLDYNSLLSENPKTKKSKIENNPFKYSHVLINI